MSYILSGLVAAVVLVGGIFLGHGLNTQQSAPQSYGAFMPVQASQFSLAGAGITNSQNTIQLASFLLPDPNKTPITMSMFGSIGYGVVDPQTSKIENVSFTGVTQNANGSATLTGVSRGLSFYAPYAASTTLALSHAGGATLILSNSGAFYGTQFLFANNNGTSTAVLAFSSSTPPHYDLDLSQTQWGLLASTTIPDIAYVNRISIAGAANSSETVNGISQLSTAAQAAAGTSAGSTGARLVLPGSLANATPSATTIVPITSTLGKLAQGFLDLTAQWIFSNLVGTNFSATNSTTTNATTTSQYIKGVLSSLLKTDSAGQVKGATYGVDYAPQRITYATSTAITAASNAFATSTGIGIPAGVITASSTIRATVAVSCVAGSTCTLLLRTATGSTVGGSCDFSANASNGGAVFGATGVGFVNIIVYMTNATNAETWQCQTSLSDNIGNVTGPTYSRTNIQNSFGSASVDLSGSNTLQLVIRGNSSTATLQNALIEVNP